MSATVFSNGSILTPAFVNSIYTAGGHYHDGSDADGHARQIDLTTDTTGILPFSKMQSSSTDGSFYVSYTNQFDLFRSYNVYYKMTSSEDTSAPAKVDLFFPYVRLNNGSSPTTFTADGTPVPIVLRPKDDGYPNNRGCEIPVSVYAGSMSHAGFLVLKKDGGLWWGLDQTRQIVGNDGQTRSFIQANEGGIWPNGDKGHPPLTVSYPVWP